MADTELPAFGHAELPGPVRAPSVAIEGAASKAPKTRASIRRLALAAGTVGVLETLRAAQVELARLAEVPLEESSFVLPMEPGGTSPMHPGTLTRAFTKARKAADVAAGIYLHSLRHFQATTLDSVICERSESVRSPASH
ncbi:MAG: hypothetical protein ACYCST_02550 [Acidimicrobiales bacterium]